MKIERRKSIDDGIMEELQKKHPIKSEKGVCYVQDMDYITLDVEAFNNATFRKLVKADSRVLMVYMYLRERMCHQGWFIKWDADTKEDIIERLTLWGISVNDSSSIITMLLENKVIYSFQHDGIEYLTDVQQIYNWEMLQAKRARDRNSKSRQTKSATDTFNNIQQGFNLQSNNEQPYNTGFDNSYDDGFPFI